MRPSRHLVISAVAGGVVWAATRNPYSMPIAVATGVLVDIDHIPDLLSTFVLRREPTATFPFHAWEWVAILIAVGFWIAFPWWYTAAIVGFGLHMFSDQVANKGRVWSYLMGFRIYHRFKVSKLAPEWDFNHAYHVVRTEIPLAGKALDLLGVEQRQEKKHQREQVR